MTVTCKTDSQEAHPHIYCHLIYNKDAILMTGGNNELGFLNKGCLINEKCLWKK